MQLVTYAFYFHKINNLLTLMKVHTNTVEGWVLYNEKNQSTFSRIVFFTLYVCESLALVSNILPLYVYFFIQVTSCLKTAHFQPLIVIRTDSGIINISQEYTRKCYTLQEKHEVTISLIGCRKLRAIYLKEINTHMFWMALHWRFRERFRKCKIDIRTIKAELIYWR